MFSISYQRGESDSQKWHKYAGTDILPMWVADTEFLAAPEIIAALEQRVAHGVFGYGYLLEGFVQGIIRHCQNQYGWDVSPEWIVPLTGVVPGLNFSRAVARLRGKNKALTVEPVYPHLRKSPAIMANFHHAFSPCELKNQRWVPDFAGLEANVDQDCGLLLLCHPHNPIGRVYDADELAQYAEIARKYDLIVCSDEIHCDLILNHRRHCPFAGQNADTLQRTITLMAPSKTFNIAGLSCAFAIIADKQLRTDFCAVSAGMSGDVNVMGMTAAVAAFEHGEPWREEMLAYLRENARITEKRINATGKLKTTPIEATYLAWIDARSLGKENPQQYFEQYGVGMNDGADFGAPGFVRLNFGCSRDMLELALDRIEYALADS